MDPIDPRDVEGIKHAYIKSDWSIQRIADEHRVSATTVRAYARKGGWVREVGTKFYRRTRYSKDRQSSDLTREQRRLQRLLKRLYKVLEQKVRIMEQRIALASEPGAEPQSAADIERDIRSINAMAKAFAQVIELEERARASDESQREAETSSGVSENADELRRDLARRLERLHRSGKAE
jgi:hypothetical protein